MFKKLIPAILTITLVTQPINCDDTAINQDYETIIEQQETELEELAKIEAKKKRRKKIIIATAITATVAAVVGTLAVVNFAPDYCPTVIRKWTPHQLVFNDVQNRYYSEDQKFLQKAFTELTKEKNAIISTSKYAQDKETLNKELEPINTQIAELNEKLKNLDEDIAYWRANGSTTVIDEDSDDWKNHKQRSTLKKELRTKKEAFEKEVGKKLENEDPTFKALIEKEKQLKEQFNYLASRKK